MSTSEGQAFATRMNALFVEASAKTAVGVQDAFQSVAERILDTPELWETQESRDEGVDLREGPPPVVQSGGCC